MALTKQDKIELAQHVKACISMGYSKNRTIDRLFIKGIFKKRTIGFYFDVFSKKDGK